MKSVKPILKRTLKIMQKVLIVYLVYRIVNILLVETLYLIRKDEIALARKQEIHWYTDFECPAPEINDCVDYDLLAWRYKVLISEKRYQENKDYIKQAKLINFANFLLPWTARVRWYRRNYEHLHFYGSHEGVSYDIAVRIGINVFTLEPEESFCYLV